ncbi:hypothetical protein V6N11_036683 [Hibiscus sabdariffa]|uniref:Protein SDA1 n=1 Tax=Hibiscus sabdariffa TaxID=183260 RepID=A0ABR2RB63_9ROSI
MKAKPENLSATSFMHEYYKNHQHHLQFLHHFQPVLQVVTDTSNKRKMAALIILLELLNSSRQLIESHILKLNSFIELKILLLMRKIRI